MSKPIETNLGELFGDEKMKVLNELGLHEDHRVFYAQDGGHSIYAPGLNPVFVDMVATTPVKIWGQKTLGATDAKS